MIGSPYKILIAASLIGASFVVGNLRGYSSGVTHEKSVQAKARAETQAELNRIGEKVAAQAGALLAMEKEREDLVQSLENDALDAAGSDRLGVSATGGLRRLQQRWGAP
tara:strand:- start:214 stop:540 length:327 start_codon:yes stop_codon:yes gene_type:complete